MWFGTQDGLNRFDGYEFKIFRNSPSDSASLSENWIWSIDEDSSGNLWMGTFGGGLNCLPRSAAQFIHFKNDPAKPHSLSHNSIWDFIEYPNGRYWVASNNGLNEMILPKKKGSAGDIKNATFEYHPHLSADNNVFKILKAKDNFLWLTTRFGIAQFDIRSGEFKHFEVGLAGKEQSDGLTGFAGKSGMFWLSSLSNGLIRFNPESKDFKQFQHDPEIPSNLLQSNLTTSVIEDTKGNIWVGSTSGLTVISPNYKAYHYSHDPADPSSLAHNYITSIYEDRNGQIWIGTRIGLCLYSPFSQKFNLIKPIMNSAHSLSDKNITCFLEDSQGYIWIGTHNGLNRFNKQSGAYRQYFHDPDNPGAGPAADYILKLFEDSHGRIWIGTRNGGASRLESGVFHHYKTDPQDPQSLSNDVVLAFYESSANQIWIGTNRGGINRYNEADDNFTRFGKNSDDGFSLNDVSVFDIFEDQNQNMWFGTPSGGINIYNTQTGKFEYLLHDPANRNSISSNRIICFYQSLAGDLWVGTAKGLNKLITGPDSLNNPQYRFRQYFSSDGLPNDVIYGILEDKSRNLWVSTNNGIGRIDVRDGKFKVKSFTKADGLQGNEFNQNAYMRDSNGRIYFGGGGGFNVFDPYQLNINPHIPPVVITGLNILNKEAPLKSKYLHSRQPSHSEAASINCTWEDNVISFEFAALDFAAPEKNQFAYKLAGFDQDWIYSAQRRFVTYTNLHPGDYVFCVKASNNDGIWNESGTQIKLSISAPPWQTWWAYLSYFLVVTLSIWTFHKIKLKNRSRILSAKAEERECVRKEIAADFHDEAGNIITKINLFVELAKRNSGTREQLETYLEKVQSNAKLLSGGMRDFIWALDPDKDTLFETLLRLKDTGDSIFEHSPIRFKTRGIIPALKHIEIDLKERRAIILIFTEAMNNALKYSQAKHADLLIKLTDNLLMISFTDDGIGFDLDTSKKGYGLQNMKRRALKIDSFLEIRDGRHKGTTVCLNKPLGDARF